MNTYYERMALLYRGLDVRDRIDAVWFMREDVLKELEKMVEAAPNPHGIKSCFGIRLEVDKNLPPGTIYLNVENQQERAMRRLLADGKHVPVVKINIDPSPMPMVPKPTLKALLRHWFRRRRND